MTSAVVFTRHSGFEIPLEYLEYVILITGMNAWTNDFNFFRVCSPLGAAGQIQNRASFLLVAAAVFVFQNDSVVFLQPGLLFKD